MITCPKPNAKLPDLKCNEPEIKPKSFKTDGKKVWLGGEYVGEITKIYAEHIDVEKEGAKLNIHIGKQGAIDLFNFMTNNPT